MSRPSRQNTLPLLLLLFVHCVQSLQAVHHRLRRNASVGEFPSSRSAAPVAAEKSNRLYGEEARQMLRELEEMNDNFKQKQITESENKAKSGQSLLDRMMSSLFGSASAVDDAGSKHDCFFSAFNCPVNPARNLAGVQRVWISAEQRQKLLAAHKRRRGHRRRGQ